MRYDSIDLAFSHDQDLVIDQYGDLQDTSFDTLVALHQLILDRARNPVGSWRRVPSSGVIDTPIGKQNTEEVAKGWERILFTALTEDGLVLPQHLSIHTAPLTQDSFITLTSVEVEPTPENGGRSSILVYSIMDLGSQTFYFY